jgi:hypothetical protein
MRQCSANKRDGSPCTLQAQGESGLCWAHDPANAEARRRGQSRGGRSKPISELMVLKGKLDTLGDNILSGKVNRGDAAVAVTAYSAAVKAIEALVKVRELEESRLIETGLKVREQEQLVERLEALEELLAEKNGRRGWGA